MEIFTECARHTQVLGEKIGAGLTRNTIFALTGPLGSGKTLFSQGLAKGLGVKTRLLSPTFILQKEYPLDHPGLSRLYHLDLYRLEDGADFSSLGLSEIFTDRQGIVLVEWAEKAASLFPPAAVWVEFSYLPGQPSSRRLIFKNYQSLPFLNEIIS